jgi:arsenite-transporting ATPase
MEISPKSDKEQFLELFDAHEGADEVVAELITSIPGIDEAMSFAEMMRTVLELPFKTVLFDTAPTGHTLRLLNFPDVLERGLNKIVSMKNVFDLLLTSMQQNPEEVYGMMFNRITEMKQIVENVNEQFRDARQTTFIAVCIPEFLSIYETERLVQELCKCRIDIGHVVVNQVVFENAECR